MDAAAVAEARLAMELDAVVAALVGSKAGQTKKELTVEAGCPPVLAQFGGRPVRRQLRGESCPPWVMRRSPEGWSFGDQSRVVVVREIDWNLPLPNKLLG